MDVSRYQLKSVQQLSQRGSVTFSNTAAGRCITRFSESPALSGFQNSYWAAWIPRRRKPVSQVFTSGLGFFRLHPDDWKIKPRFTRTLDCVGKE